MNTKRLFLFAAYDPAAKDGLPAIIDESQIIYIRELAKMGDVIFYMDNELPQSEFEKISKYVIYSGANRHGEYDFGSYKRAYKLAKDILKNYDYIYLVNDSVYAPVKPLIPVVEKMESKNTDVYSMAYKRAGRTPHMQSWFLGITNKVFMSEQFDSFVNSITKKIGKGAVIWAYELGFTKLCIKNNWSWTSAFTVSGRGVYNRVKSLFLRGFPFIKKMSINRKQGATGRQILYVLDHTDKELKAAIINDANRIFGTAYVKKLLTRNIFKIWLRNIKHFYIKIFIEGI